MGLGHSPKIITDNLILCLDAMDKRSYPGSGTTWIDRSLYNTTATLVNGPIFSEGSHGGVISFDGTDDHIELFSDMPQSTTEATIEFWVKVLSNTTGYLWYFDDSQDPEVRFYYDSSGWMAFGGYDVDGYEWLEPPVTSSFSINEWHHVVGTFEPNNARLYYDGVLQGTDTSNSVTMNTSNINRIGARGYLLQPLNFELSLMRMYDRFFTHSEILQNYEAQKGRFI